MPSSPVPKSLHEFVDACARGQVRALQGARMDAGGWHYTVRYDEGPDTLYPKPHAIPPSWVQAAVRGGLVRPVTVDLLQSARVMDFVVPNAETRRSLPAWAQKAREARKGERKASDPTPEGEGPDLFVGGGG